MPQIKQESTTTPTTTSLRSEAKGSDSPTPPIRFVAEVAPVQEVTLHGRADLRYWNEKLLPEGFDPVEADGRAQLFLSATEARFWGIRFRECIVGIHVQRSGNSGSAETGLYLLHAWNSLRAFAWVERTFFHTPYYPGTIALETGGSAPGNSAGLTLTDRSQTLITAQSNQRVTSEEPVNEHWEGKIFLPRRNQSGPQQYFIAKLSGATNHLAFSHSSDICKLQPAVSCPVIGWLEESGFTPTLWNLRQAAAHAKSKTYCLNQPVV